MDDDNAVDDYNDDDGNNGAEEVEVKWSKINKLTSVFHASVLLLIMNFVITLSK